MNKRTRVVVPMAGEGRWRDGLGNKQAWFSIQSPKEALDAFMELLHASGRNE
jgi:hypothetical protein